MARSSLRVFCRTSSSVSTTIFHAAILDGDGPDRESRPGPSYYLPPSKLPRTSLVRAAMRRGAALICGGHAASFAERALLLLLVLACLSPSLHCGAKWGRVGVDQGRSGACSKRGMPHAVHVGVMSKKEQQSVQRLRGAGPDAHQAAYETGDAEHHGAEAGAEGEASRVGAEGENVQEGMAMLQGTRGGKVFYNRVQVVNRDLSVLVLRWFVGQHAREMDALHLRKLDRLRNASLCANGTNATAPDVDPAADGVAVPPGNATAAPERKVRVLDAMSATGLRAIRYALEVPELGTITANDRDPKAVEAIRSNLALSHVPAGKVQAVESDAVSLMLARAGIHTQTYVYIHTYIHTYICMRTLARSRTFWNVFPRLPIRSITIILSVISLWNTALLSVGRPNSQSKVILSFTTYSVFLKLIIYCSAKVSCVTIQ